ncbi:MAG TPA: dihydrolipoamide acetyltransferase family protein [Planctomycetota bacterium]|nr:dihydrolipoamide acetyltransferase family protein [Planctomycetota bacterium]
MTGELSVPMPQMGESIAEGTLVKWFKQVGDKVKRDEPLFEISTDKVDTEVPSPRDGFLLRVLVKEGETVPVRTVVCILGDKPAAGAGPETNSAPGGAASEAGPPRATSGARNAPPVVAPRGGRGKAAVSAEEPAAASRGARLREKSSPLVRRLAAEHGVEITDVTGTGAEGRVTREDILNHISKRGSKTPREAAPVEDRLEPMSHMRLRIAEHMVSSRKTSAHVTSVFEVDMTATRARKDSLAPTFEERHKVKLTYLPFVIRAVTTALRKFPALNASIEGKSVRYHAGIHLGVAVALDDGLIVPVIRNADRQDLAELARSLGDVASRARSKNLKPEDVQGGTFTITNPGVFGTLIGTPIISQPQVAILCLGAVVKRPVVLPGTDAIAIRSMAYLSLSYDHRLVDGAMADRFLADVRFTLEEAVFGE